MNAYWQNIIAVGIVGLAAAHLAFRAWKLFAAKKQAGCGGGCHGCNSNTTTATPQETVVPLEMLAKPPRKS